MSEIRNFDDTFCPKLWAGFRTLQFNDDSDAFQQLIGDALKCEFPNQAYIATTLGRDGSIDAWVDAPSTQSAHSDQFKTLAFPIIIECKQHDTNSNNLASNITQGWIKVKDKLSKNADKGWQGNCTPWLKAQSYIYCISARFASADERNKLQDSIRDFFDSLPKKQRPPIKRENILIWDWGNIAHWLRTSSRLADDWLGVNFTEVEEHGAYRHRLSQSSAGFHTYLLSENLAYIAPAIHQPYHPDNLFKRISNAESLVLVGDGGVGKTRVVFEVAQIAYQAGWRVLNLRPSEKEIDLPTISEELLRNHGQTLVIADYIDQFRDFDGRYWLEALLPEATRRGIKLVLLANARPLTASQILPRLTEQKLFTIVEMSLSKDQREQVTHQIELSICPKAIIILGESNVRELCGNRPIIAMLIARELESLAVENRLQPNALPRPGDLVGWIMKRLREDQLLPITTSIWDALTPTPTLCVVTAIMAACNIPEYELIEVAKATLAVQGITNSNQASSIVAILKRGGWLEVEENKLRVPHDAVTDEILQYTLGHYPECMSTVFASATQGRPLGHFAISLSRLAYLGNNDSSILKHAALWLKQNAAIISNGLIGADPDASAYALGAVFNCPLLSQAALEAWPQLISPWLDHHTKHPSARHLIYRGLKQLPVTEQHRLLGAAATWLKLHVSQKEAGFILAPLLEWESTRLGVYEAELLTQAMAWLDQFPLEKDAHYVFEQLLEWESTRLGVYEAELLMQAMAWLDQFPLEKDADFILAPLLKLGSTRLGAYKTKLLTQAMAWLDQFPLEKDAHYVFEQLMNWESSHLDTHEAKLLTQVMAWLGSFGSMPDAVFILNKLLKKKPLSTEDRKTCIQYALELFKNKTEHDTPFLLTTLLQQASRYSNSTQASQIIILAGHWLDDYPLHTERVMILARLLRIKWLPGAAWEKAAKAALDSLESKHLLITDDYPLNGLVTRMESLNEIDQLRWVTLCCQWFEVSQNQFDCESILINCVKFFTNGIPSIVQTTLNAQYNKRFPNNTFDWSKWVSLKRNP